MKFALAYDFLSDDPREPLAINEIVAHTVLAEKLGFDSIWAGESHHQMLENGHLPSPLFALTFVSSATKRIRLGTGVLLLPLYDPLKLAEDTAVLDCLSGGRLKLGVGIGSDANRAYFNVPKADIGQRFEEAIHLIDQLWRKPTVTYRGKHFICQKLSVIPKPVQKPRPPIVIGGGLRGAERAARLGDGWIGASNHAKGTIRDLISIYKKAVQKGKRSFVVVNRVCYVAKDDSSAIGRTKQPFTGFIRWYSERGALKNPKGVDLDWHSDLEEAMEEFPIIGSPDTCIKTIEQYADMGVDQLNLRIRLPGIRAREFEEVARLLSEKVLPYFDRR